MSALFVAMRSVSRQVGIAGQVDNVVSSENDPMLPRYVTDLIATK
jgi:hypothetical protein